MARKEKNEERLKGHSYINENSADGRALIRLVQVLSFTLMFYVLICLLMNYLPLVLKYMLDFSHKKYTTAILVPKISYFFKPATIGLPMTLIIALALSMLLTLKLDTSWAIRNGNKTIKGKAHFITEEEVSHILSKFPENNISEARSGGIPLFRENGNIYVDTETIHSLIIGTTRSGKGQTFVLPMIRYIANAQVKHSMVLNDPKGELLENSYDMLVNQGYNVAVLNLRDTQYSNLWNPLQIIIDEYRDRRDGKDGNTDLSKCMKLAQALANVFTQNDKSDPIWPESAKSLFVSMLLFLLEHGYDNGHLDNVSLYSVYQMFIEFGTANEQRGNTTVNALDELFNNLPIGNPARSSYATSNFASGDMRSSIFSTLASNLNLFGFDVGVSKLTSGNQINFRSLADPDKPMAIFMLIPDNEKSRYVLSTLFVNQCYDELVEYADEFKSQKLPQRVHFILDEFGNMVPIPGMDTKITVGAGRNLLFDLFIQDFNQLDTKYSNAAKTIRSNCGNLVYINSLDDDTNKYFSSVLGNKTVEYTTYSGNLHTWLDHQSRAVDGQPLATSDELANMEPGMAITKRQRSYPMITQFEFYYKLGLPSNSTREIAEKMELIDRPLEDTIYPLDEIWATLIRRTAPAAHPENSQITWRQAAMRLEKQGYVWQMDATDSDTVSFFLTPQSKLKKSSIRTNFAPSVKKKTDIDDIISKIEDKNHKNGSWLKNNLDLLFSSDIDTDQKITVAKALIKRIRQMVYISADEKSRLERYINTTHNG